MGIDWVRWRGKLVVGAVVLVATAAVAFLASSDDEQVISEVVASATSTTSAGSSTSRSSTTVSKTSAGDEQESESSPTTATTTTTTAPAVIADEQTSGNLTARATIEPGAVSPSEFVEFSTHVTDSDGDVTHVVWDFGDGRSTPPLVSSAGCPGGGPQTRPTEITDVQRHAYRLPGRYQAVATVTSGARPCQQEPPTEDVRLQVEIVVQEGPTYSNGPLFPTLSLTDLTTEEHAQLGVSGHDRDGYIEKVQVDWGDGTEPDLLSKGLGECDDPETTWPGSILSELINHSYAKEGTYEVTVTAWSSGCDGTDRQQAQDTITLRWPQPDITSATSGDDP